MLASKLLPQLLKRCFLNQLAICNPVSTKTLGKNSQATYSPVYSFPHIRTLAIINKAKVYQTLATCIAIPASYAMSIGDICSTDVCVGISACGISGCFLLHTLGYLTSNTVGIIYLNKDENTSKISYLDAWGSRRDIEIDLKDIIPFSDQPSSITDPLYLKLCQYTCKDTFKMNVKYGVVLNPTKFEAIFHKR